MSAADVSLSPIAVTQPTSFELVCAQAVIGVRPSSSSFFIDPAPRRCSRSSSTSWLTLSIDLPPNGKRQPVLDYRAYRVPELIPVLGSQPAGDVSHKPAVGCYNFPPGPQLLPQPLRGLLPISLLDEQRHDGCEQFA